MYFKSKKLLTVLIFLCSTNFILSMPIEKNSSEGSEYGQELVEKTQETGCTMTVMGQKHSCRYWALIALFVKHEKSVSGRTLTPDQQEQYEMRKSAIMNALIKEKEQEKFFNKMWQKRSN